MTSVSKFIRSVFCIVLLPLVLLGRENVSRPIDHKRNETLSPTREMRAETIYMVRCMEELHLEHRDISELDNKEILLEFLSELDKNKMIFLQSEVDAFVKKFTPTLDVFVSGGSLTPAFSIFEKFRNRFYNRMDWVFDRLDRPFDFSSDETFVFDRKKCAWPFTREESDKLWEKRLKREIIAEAFSICKSNHSKIYENNSEEESSCDAAETAASESGEADQSFDESIELGFGGDSELQKLSSNSNKTYENCSDVESLCGGAKTETSETSELDQSFNRDIEFDVDGSLKFPKLVSKCTEEDVVSCIPEATENIRKRYKNIESAYEDFDAWMLQEMFLNSVSKMYDPHTSFLSRESYEELSIHIKNSLVGIGAELRDENGTCTINKLTPGGPAQLSGQIKPGDKIIAVAQGDDGEFVDIVGMRLNKAVKLLRGQKDTVVLLKINTASGDIKIVRLVRDKINLNATRASAKYFEIVNNENKVVRLGVIELPSFYGDVQSDDGESVQAHKDVETLLSILKEKNIDGLVLDLRQNGGGLLNEAISIAGLFIPKGPVVHVKDSFGHVETFSDDDNDVKWDGRLVILSSSMSASASEILIGAMKDHKRALIVGAKYTYGKGSVQAALDMNMLFNSINQYNRLGAAYITIQKWYLPTGISTQLEGVSPDIELSGLDECFHKREADYPHALKCDKITPAHFDFEANAKNIKHSVTGRIVSELSKLSKNRQESLEEFDIERERMRRFDDIVNRKECSLSIKKLVDEKYANDQQIDDINIRIKKLRGNDSFLSEDIKLPDVVEDNNYSCDKENDMDDIMIFDVNLRECLRILSDWVDLDNSSAN